ncbi:MAG: Transcriptional regulator [Nitrosopumilales archaeon]|nr:MAG: Transcriptional regulator [Nitrosopumilales archaeon]
MAKKTVEAALKVEKLKVEITKLKETKKNIDQKNKQLKKLKKKETKTKKSKVEKIEKKKTKKKKVTQLTERKTKEAKEKEKQKAKEAKEKEKQKAKEAREKEKQKAKEAREKEKQKAKEAREKAKEAKEKAERTLEEELQEQLSPEEIEGFQIEKVNMEKLTNKVCVILAEKETTGMIQSELWKKLKLSSRDGSRLALKLERMGTITREKILEKGRWTYKLIIKKTPISTESIENAPCLTCPVEQKCTLEGEVSPRTCEWIEDWVTIEIKKPKTAQ